jgi:hypothetical protein
MGREAAIGAAKAAVMRAPRIILRLGACFDRRHAEKNYQYKHQKLHRGLLALRWLPAKTIVPLIPFYYQLHFYSQARKVVVCSIR